MPKNSEFGGFFKTKVLGQTMLPDGSFLPNLKLLENAKIQKFKCDILDDFQASLGAK